MNISALGTASATPKPNILIIMAAKKTAKKTSEVPSKEPAKAATPSAKKTAKKAAKKASSPKADSKPAPKAKATTAPTNGEKPSIDAVTRAAYLIYRRRVELGLPGDSHNDWLEAERQLGVID